MDINFSTWQSPDRLHTINFDENIPSKRIHNIEPVRPIASKLNVTPDIQNGLLPVAIQEHSSKQVPELTANRMTRANSQNFGTGNRLSEGQHQQVPAGIQRSSSREPQISYHQGIKNYNPNEVAKPRQQQGHPEYVRCNTFTAAVDKTPARARHPSEVKSIDRTSIKVGATTYVQQYQTPLVNQPFNPIQYSSAHGVPMLGHLTGVPVSVPMVNINYQTGTPQRVPVVLKRCESNEGLRRFNSRTSRGPGTNAMPLQATTRMPSPGLGIHHIIQQHQQQLQRLPSGLRFISPRREDFGYNLGLMPPPMVNLPIGGPQFQQIPPFQFNAHPSALGGPLGAANRNALTRLTEMADGLTASIAEAVPPQQICPGDENEIGSHQIKLTLLRNLAQDNHQLNLPPPPQEYKQQAPAIHETDRLPTSPILEMLDKHPMQQSIGFDTRDTSEFFPSQNTSNNLAANAPTHLTTESNQDNWDSKNETGTTGRNLHTLPLQQRNHDRAPTTSFDNFYSDIMKTIGNNNHNKENTTGDVIAPSGLVVKPSARISSALKVKAKQFQSLTEGRTTLTRRNGICPQQNGTLEDTYEINRSEVATRKPTEESSMLRLPTPCDTEQSGQHDSKETHGSSSKTRIVYPNKEVYQGEVIFGKRYGNGTLYYPDGSVKYAGDWEEDTYNGTGTLHNQFAAFVDEDYTFNYTDFAGLKDFWVKYEGNFVNGRIHGQGTIFLVGDEKFTGTFRNGKANGVGVFTKRDGEVIRGKWQTNKLISNEIHS